jgi:putative DNA primase/helicase
MNTFDNWFERQKKQFEETKAPRVTSTPTYPARDAMSVEQARERVATDFDALIREAEEWWQLNPPNEPADEDPFERFGREALQGEPPPVHAQRSPTGVGKTRVGAKEIAADRQRRQLIQERSPLATRPWGYFGPTHRLNESTAEQFREQGLSAQVYYGRGAWDRGVPGNEDLPEDKRVLMCLKPERVALAIAAHQSVPDTCCHKKPRRGKGGKEEKCEHFDEGSNQCGYQKQFNGGPPDVWLAPHEMLFHAHRALSELAGIIVDETFWAKGVYGIGEGHASLTLDELLPPDPITDYSALAQAGTMHRRRLLDLLREHPMGGLQRERFIGEITQEHCTYSIGQEWDIVDRVKMTPEMTPAQIEEVKELLPECRRARRMATVYRTLRDLLKNEDIKVSGRLILAKRKDGKTVLRVRGVRDIVKARQVPTMLLDATLPDESILRKFHPQVQVVSDVQVEMPHVRVRQVLRSPTSETKLWGREAEREKNPDAGLGNRKAVRRYVLRRWLEIDGHQRWLDSGRQRKPLVVICQKKYHEWLASSGLPEGIALEHYNAIAGLDDYKDVDCLILVGRVVPKPAEVEAFSGALTGAEPLSEAASGWWYGRVARAIGMIDGTGIEVENCDQHVDPMAEMVRYQVCEGELVQSVGRGRGVNRTAKTPLDIDILADVVLPITVHEVVSWEEPSELVEMMASEGVVLTAPADMATAFPWLWKTAEHAKWTLKKLRAAARGGTERSFPTYKESYVGKLLSVPSHALQYQRAGAKQKFHWASFDPRKWPVARAWYEARGWVVALRDYLWPGELKPMAGAGKVEIADRLVWILHKVRYPLSPDWHQHKAYTGVGRPGRYSLSKDPGAMTAYAGQPGGITTPYVDAYSALPTELRMYALGLHENFRAD